MQGLGRTQQRRQSYEDATTVLPRNKKRTSKRVDINGRRRKLHDDYIHPEKKFKNFRR